MVAVPLVGETGVLCWDRPLTEHHHRPQVHLVVYQSLGVVTVRQVHPDHLLIDGVQVVQSPLHHRQGQRLVDSLLVNDGPPVCAVTVDNLNLGVN